LSPETTTELLRNLTYHLIIDSGASKNITLNGTLYGTPEEILATFENQRQRNEAFIDQLVDKSVQNSDTAEATSTEAVQPPANNHFSPLSSGDDDSMILY
jgi:hypothetical protein